jgi:two-component system chemotaxis response regulator CheB
MTVELVVMGASLGGIDALERVLRALPEGLGAAVAIVQHRRADAGSRLGELLDSRSTLPVYEVEDKMPMAPAAVYLAPADYHLLVESRGFALSIDEPVCAARPSIDVLFESAADVFGDRLVGVLLTGASEDGADGIARVKAAGGVTIVQEPTEAASPIAPRAALARCQVDHVLTLDAIGPLLARLCKAAG